MNFWKFFDILHLRFSTRFFQNFTLFNNTIRDRNIFMFLNQKILYFQVQTFQNTMDFHYYNTWFRIREICWFRNIRHKTFFYFSSIKLIFHNKLKRRSQHLVKKIICDKNTWHRLCISFRMYLHADGLAYSFLLYDGTLCITHQTMIYWKIFLNCIIM